GAAFLGPKERRLNGVVVRVAPGRSPFPGDAVQLQEVRAQPIRVFHTKQPGFLYGLAQRTSPVLSLRQALHCGVEQLYVEFLFVEGPPHGVTGERLDRLDARLAAATLFGQGLDDFQSVETVVLGDVIGNRHNLAQSRASPDIRWRSTPRDRHRGAGHDWDLQLTRAVVNELGILPVVGQMLVDEYRDNAPAFTKHFQRRLPEAAFRVLGIAQGRLGILSVLGYQQHPI